MANEYIRKEWAGGTIRTTLNGNINASATSITLTDGSSFPSGVKPFVLVIDRGTAAEEKIICTSRTGNTLTVLQRGYDGSSAQSHTSGAYVEHILDAYTVDQANAMSAAMTTQGDIIYKTVTGDNTSFGRLGIGTTGYPLVSAGSAPAYQQLGQTGIASTAVTAAKINSDVAGLGLVKNGGTGALDVNVDNSTIEIATDTVQVKNAGITGTKIANNTIADTNIASGANIAYSKLNLASAIQRSDFAVGFEPIVICTDTTRPTTGLVEGQIIYETNTDRILSYNGTAWVIEQAEGTYTPTLVNINIGTTGSNTASWVYRRGLLHVRGVIRFNGTGFSITANSTISLPLSPYFTVSTVDQKQNCSVGNVWFDTSVAQYAGMCAIESTGTPSSVAGTVKVLTFSYDGAQTGLASVSYRTPSGTVPTTWPANGDEIRWNATIAGTLAP